MRLGQIITLKVAKRAVKFCIGLQEMNDDIVEGSVPPKRKETSKVQPSEKKDDGGTPGLVGTLSGNRFG
jgi:hypothetical protein